MPPPDSRAVADRLVHNPRLRANIVLEGAVAPFVEDAWDEILFRREDSSPNIDAPISCICRTTRCQVRRLSRWRR
jgi:hypothetical protein